MRRFETVLCSIFIFFASRHLQAQITVTSTVDKSEITVGDMITYSINIVYSDQVEIIPPVFGNNLGQFEIRDIEMPKETKEDGKIISTMKAIISIYEVGEFTIPAIEIKYKLKGEEGEKTCKTEEHKIVVKSVAASEEEGLKPAKPVESITPDMSGYYILAGIVVLIAGMGFMAFYLIRYYREKRQKAHEMLKPPRSAHEIAFERLKALSESNLIVEGKFKEYFSQLSEILKEYLGCRFGIDTLERTTEELSILLKETPLEKNQYEMVMDCLSFCDLVKFAKYIPDDREIQISFDQAWQIVEQTKLIFSEVMAEQVQVGAGGGSK